MSRSIAGRPKKYSPAAFKRGVNKYFASISREKALKEKVCIGTDDAGKDIYRWEPVKNVLGEDATVIEYFQRPSVSGLCGYLHMHRDTFNEYSRHEDYADICAAAKNEIEAYLCSQLGSGKGDSVDLMKNATAKAKAAAPDLAIDGEMQFDAAFSPVVAQTKCKGSPVAGQANTFIFPDINAGNIGYKIAQRLGGFAAYGPILQGLNAPINDLSRGCDAEEVYQMAIITAGLK